MGKPRLKITTARSMVALLGVALMLAGALTTRWWTRSTGSAGFEVGMGLRGISRCHRKACEFVSYERVALEKDRAFIIFGSITYHGTFIAAAATALAWLLLVLGKPLHGPISLARIGTLMCFLMLLMAILFVVLRPDEDGTSSMGYSLPLYMTGAAMGMIGAYLLAELESLC